jgi:hypothetical protein
MSTGRVSDRRSRGVGVGAAAYCLRTGSYSPPGPRACRPSRGRGLELCDGQFSVALPGLEAGALLGLQLGGLIVPRVGSRRALTPSLVVFTCELLGPAFAPSLLLLAASLFAFAALDSVVDVAMNTQGLAPPAAPGPSGGLRAARHVQSRGVLGPGAGALAARGRSGGQDRMSSWRATGTTNDWRHRGTWSWSETL